MNSPKGSYCSELYEEVYQAKVSLCNRLGVQEDSDIEDSYFQFAADRKTSFDEDV